MEAQANSRISRRRKNKTKTHRAIMLKITVVMVTTVITITIISLIMGTIFLTDKLSDSIEQDMLVVVDIADQYVSSEIELLKLKAKDAAI